MVQESAHLLARLEKDKCKIFPIDRTVLVAKMNQQLLVIDFM